MNNPLREPLDRLNPIVYLDISVGLEFTGRIVIELRKDVVPKTAENFRALCTGERGIGKMGKPLHYKGCKFHKVIRVYAAQGGDIVNNDGSCGDSIYGPVFDDESLKLPHDEGVITMINYGTAHSNNSQFAITAVPCTNLDGTNVVMGRVLRGLAAIADMENVADDDGKPGESITITDCGEIPAGDDWAINDNDETEDKLPPFPQDWPRKFDKFTLEDALEILVSIRKAGNHFYQTERLYEARRKYRKANRYSLLLRKRFEEQRPKTKDDQEAMDKFYGILEQFDAVSVINNVNMAAVELKLENYTKARQLASEALKHDPNNYKAYFRRGQAQLALKNYDEAVRDLKQAHELFPTFKPILNELNRAKKVTAEYDRKQGKLLKNLFK